MTLKRVGAYLIDMLIVAAIITLFSKIEILNPYSKEYEAKQNELTEVTKDYLLASTHSSSGIENITEQINDLSYEISKYSFSTNIINLIVIIIYFILFQYFNNGQTVGKQLLGIKIVNMNNKKASLIQIIIRSIIIYGILTQGITLLLLAFSSKELYLNLYTFISIIESSLILITFIFILFREDKRGLHDLIVKTNVINSR